MIPSYVPPRPPASGPIFNCTIVPGCGILHLGVIMYKVGDTLIFNNSEVVTFVEYRTNNSIIIFKYSTGELGGWEVDKNGHIHMLRFLTPLELALL